MLDNFPEQQMRRENFERDKVRFVGYDLLKLVTFKDEPVVPAVLSNGDGDKHFYVEKLGGEDFRNVVFDEGVSPIDKLSVIDHVIGQLQAIDQAGVVLFDRAARNIRVLRYGSSGISTRQLDIEEFYVKASRTVYSSGYSFNGPRIEYYKEMGYNLWGETVAWLSTYVAPSLKNAGLGTRAFSDRKYTPLAWGEYDEHIKAGKKKPPNPLSNQDVLSVLKQDIEKLIIRLEQ
jgi:hypothetical protein